jgi:replicative DNA helicase
MSYSAHDVIQPPHSLQSEQGVIGALLLDNAAWLKVQGVLVEGDFYTRQHQFIFRAIRRLFSDNQPVDVITVAEFLESKGFLDQVGDIAYIGLLARDTPSSANIASYAKIVKDRSLLRQLISLGNEITGSGFNTDGKEAEALLADAEKKIFKLRQHQLKGRDGFVKLKDALKEVLENIEQNFENPPVNGVLGVSSGFHEVDEVLNGFISGLYIIAGRPSMGKTSLAMNFGENAAINGVPVAVFSLEMPVEQLAQRMLAGSASLPVRLMRESWQIEESGWPKLTAGLQRIADIPLWVDDSGGQSVADIRAKCMRLNSEIRPDYPQGIGMIIIDYLQLMNADDERSNGNQNDRISQISRGLKLLSKEFNVPVLVLSQLNRKVEERGNKRPICADLRDSGAIEQDADVIMFVYRDEVYNTDSPDKGVAEVIVSKHRNGALGVARLLFEGFSTRFRSFK